MEILNLSIFKSAVINGKVNFPNHSLSLIVKGTFDLVPGAAAVPAKVQLHPTGEQFYVEDEEMKGSCRYESDFAYFKPCADLLLVGKCHVPDGKAAPRCFITFRIGTRSRTLVVFGDRYWTRSLDLFSSASTPIPFTEMELRYENSYGGEGYESNPIGKGDKKTEIEGKIKVQALPNIEDPNDLINSPGARSEPAGFGPLGKMWQLRKSKLGTYRGTWLKERWPWFPEDFNWSYYNAAPPGMQFDGYLRGDEELFFENLHPKYPQYRSRLPGLRLRCFLNELNQSAKDMTVFREVPMNLDTLWVDMGAEKLVLVWRGVVNVRDEDYEEVQHVFIVSEQVAEPTATREFYEDLFKSKIAAAREEESMPVEEPNNQERAESINSEIAKAEAEMRSALVAAGIDPDQENPPPSEQMKAEEARILKELGIEETESPPLTRDQLMARISRKESFAGEDLSGIDLCGLDMKEIDFQKAILAGASLRNTDFSDSNLSEANLARASLSGVKFERAALKNADFTGADLTNANFTGATLDSAIFEKAKLENAVLDHAKGKNANFSQANLTQASFQNADLNGADLSKSILNQATFCGSMLREASIAGATGIEINMDDTDLSGVRAADGANFSKGSFKKARGAESIWQKANLQEADFSFSEMERADFTSAALQKAVFFAANMKWAKFRKVNMTEAICCSVNLFQGSLEKANLTKVDFTGANLYGVEFLEAVAEQTVFKSANLKMTKMAGRQEIKK